MNENLLEFSIEVPLNAVPYHEFQCRLELRLVFHAEGESRQFKRFLIQRVNVSRDHDA